MSVTVDVTGTAFNSATSPCASSTSITVGASATCLLAIVEIDDAATTITAPTWNGVSMTLIGTGVTSDNLGRASLYGLVNPASGANSLSCSFSGGAPGSMQICAISFKGSITSSVASCFTGFTSAQSSLASYTISVTSPTGDITVCAGNGNNGSFNSITATSSTSIFNVTTTFDAAASRAPGSGTVTWTASLASAGVATVLIGCDVAASGVAASNPFHNYNWPNPQPVNWYQSWTQSQQLSRPVTFNNFDWPLPKTYPRPDEFYEFGNVQFISQQPASFFHNYDWPNPQPVNWDRHWFQNLVITFPAGSKPFNQSDWENPQPINWYQYWSQNLVINSPIVKPFIQTDWPNPVGNPRPDGFYSFNNIEVISNQPASVFNQYNWPNPAPVQWYQDWSQRFKLTNPVAQYDWPLPKTWTPIDQYWSDNVINLVTQTNPTPFNQSDWPLPKVPTPIDQYWFQALVLNLPEPPPPPAGPISGGRQIWLEELDDLTLASHKWHQRLIEAHSFKTGEEISKIAAALGKKGGEARAKALTSTQRSNIASKAAQTRWK